MATPRHILYSVCVSRHLCTSVHKYHIHKCNLSVKGLLFRRVGFFFISSVDQRMRAFERVVCKLILEGRNKFEYSKTWSSDYQRSRKQRKKEYKAGKNTEVEKCECHSRNNFIGEFLHKTSREKKYQRSGLRKRTQTTKQRTLAILQFPCQGIGATMGQDEESQTLIMPSILSKGLPKWHQW